MPLDWNSLKAYVGASSEDDAFTEACWSEATALVTREIGTYEVPAEIVGRATLEVGAELWNRRQAPNGVSQFAAFDGSAIRVARDPMVGARPLLAPYLGLGFA